MTCIFLIGPGGAGKSTVGKILSSLLGYQAIDLDDEFCERVLNIRTYIKHYGYESYLEQNSLLLDKLIKEYSGSDILFILSSGFLSTDIRSDIVAYNKKLVSENGRSVLLMPSHNYNEALQCILERQLKRGFSLTKHGEEAKFRQRFYEYIALGDIQFFSMEEPECIAFQIANLCINHFGQGKIKG